VISNHQHLCAVQNTYAFQEGAQKGLPESIFTMTLDHYEEFLKERRKLMAQKMREYYFGL
jgi:hypothetical protein